MHLIKSLKEKKAIFWYCAKAFIYGDKLKVVKKGKSNKKVFVYNHTNESEGFFSIVTTILGFFNYCIKNKMAMVIDLKYNKNAFIDFREIGLVNGWDIYFNPISSIDLNEALSINHYEKPKYIIYGLKYLNYIPRFFIKLVNFRKKIDFPTTTDFLKNRQKYLHYCYLYNNFFIPTPHVKQYIDAEYNSIFPKNKKVLALVHRGTDYVQKKPYGHHIQPNDSDFLNVVEHFLEKNKDYNYIYIASDTFSFVDLVRKKFKKMTILTNKRVYYDNFSFENDNLTNIKTEQTTYFRNISYFSSIFLTSRCNSLIAGLCCGTQMALIMNNNKYEHVHLFNLGFYGVKGDF